jgi:hypothetical protein
MPTSPHTDRRNAPRAATRASYRVLVRVAPEEESDRQAFLFCSSHDISTHGVRLDAERSLPVGAQLACSFFLPGSRQIEARGEIVRAQPVAPGQYVHGVRWLDLGPEESEAIAAFVRRTGRR